MHNIETYEWTGPTGVRFIQERSPQGTYYHHTTPISVRGALDGAIDSRRRLRLFYGDTKTGKAWDEEYNVLGRIGRSTGRIKIPLMIANARSSGGPAIMDDCIVAIADAPGQFVYRHPNLKLGDWTVGPAVSEGYVEASYRDGELIGMFKRKGAAQRHCLFMKGERFAK